MDSAPPKTVKLYVDQNSREPFAKWLDGLRDAKARRSISRRIEALEYGHYGDVKPVGNGVSELRIFSGPGYRVYFGEEGNDIVILLCGGDKDSQSRDIKTAHTYWKEYKNRANSPYIP